MAKEENTAQKSAELLVWMDLEMTGLDPRHDTILEAAVLITNANLEIIAEGPELVIQQDPSHFDKMDDWNRKHHTESGLWAKAVASSMSLDAAEQALLTFVQQYVGARQSPLCGNSIWQDRRFIAVGMPRLDAYLHYRLIDVSTVKELAHRWYPSLAVVQKKGRHRALDDIRESISELLYYRRTLFQPVTATMSSPRGVAEDTK